MVENSITPAHGVGHSGGVERGSLGIYAKTESAPLVVDPETGEILQGIERDHRMVRAERYALKAAVNRLLPTSRTSKCMRWKVPKQSLKVHKSDAHGRAFYSGLQVCASVWACPVCSAKISERRRAELVTAVEAAKLLQHQVYLLTLTVPHGLGDDVNKVVDGVLSAWRKCSTSRAGKSLRRELGIQGTVRALEVTHGQNGFHPHLHVLLFLDGNHSPEQVQELFSSLWQAACVKAGLPRPSLFHGCRVDDGSYAARYASKWGIESEMTKNHVKKGKNGSMSPWDFLRKVLAKDEGHEKSAALFRVYADAFKGRRQLYWSNGLREYLNLSVDVTDEEIAAEQDDHATVLAEITLEQWRSILFTKNEAQVLSVAEDRPADLPAFLASLIKITPSRYLVASSPPIGQRDALPVNSDVP